MSFEFFIGRRYLRARKKEAFLSLITLLSIAGVTVGVMALIVVIAVMAGFEDDLKSRILGVESHVVIKSHAGPFVCDRQVLDTIGATRGVTAAAPFIYAQVMLRSAGGVSGAVLRGIDPAGNLPIQDNFDVSVLTENTTPVRPSTGPRPPADAIVIGVELARNLGLVEGDTVYLISPRGMVSPIGHIPSMHRFRIAGLFESGMYEYDATLAYTSLPIARKILRMGNRVTGIEVWVEDIFKAGKLAAELSGRLGPSFQASDWMQMNRNLFSALKLEKVMMFVILTLIVLVAAFNIASALIMTVMQKRKDIAILKAMGATARSIQKIFVYKGMVIGLTGTMIGTSLGLLLCFLLERYRFVTLPRDVYYIATLPILLEISDVLLISASALAICFLATLYPARQAARINPVEAIRYG